MQVFSLDVQKLKRSRFWESTYVCIYILIELFFFGVMTLPYMNGGKWVGDELWKLAYFGGVAGLLLVLLVTIRLLVRCLTYYGEVLNNYKEYKVRLEPDVMSVDTGKKQFIFAPDKVHLTNHLVSTNLKNPFFGHGFLHIYEDQQLLVTLPSALFDFSTGAYQIRELFRNHPNYSEQKTNPKILLRQISNNQ